MKKTISVLLTLCILIGMLPTVALSAGSMVLALEDVKVESGTTSVTVNMSVKDAEAFAAMGIKLEYDTTNLTLTNVAFGDSLASTGGTLTPNLADNSWNADWGSDVTPVDGTAFVLTFSVSENASGEYKLNAKLSDAGCVNSDLDDVVPTFTAGSITVGSSEEEEVTASYTAAVATDTASVNNDGTSKVNVNVNVGGTTKSFSSTEIELTYDPAFLSFSTGSCNLTAAVTENQQDQSAEFIVAKDNDGNETGTLTIRDYGGSMTVEETGTTAYTLTFSPVKGGTTEVKLTSAGFSTQSEAETKDLIAAELSTATVKVTINHKATVTIGGEAGTTTYVTPGGNYEYIIKDYNTTKYAYTVTATEGTANVDASRISIDSKGNVTITNVTDALAVTITTEANTYTITWKDGENAITSGKDTTEQSYGTAVSFEVMGGKAPTTDEGYYYEVKAYLTDDTNTSITVTPSDTTADAYAAKTYTIGADDISGNITIEVTKKEVDANQVTITIEGTYTELEFNDEKLTSSTVTVTKDKEVTVTVDEEDGYTYKVETVVGATTTKLEKNDEGNYTFTPNGEMTLKVTKTLDTDSLEVSQYVQLDGKTMWLVTVNTTQISGKTYTYKASDDAAAENFYWSSKYNEGNGAYCFLVITDTNTDADSVKADVASKLGLTGTGATSISYDGNVNGSDNKDVNDAQLVWNMYSAVYSEITTDVTVQKFLEADMNGSGTLETADAAAVIDSLT